MRSAVTLSLVPEARGGPFVYWDDAEQAFQAAAKLGFDAIELFAPSPAALPVARMRQLLDSNGLNLAAVGTGSGMVIHRFSLTDPDSERRQAALRFASALVDYAGQLGAPAIVGSMQGKWQAPQSRSQALDLLADAMNELSAQAERHGVPIIFEPVNRYETNLITSLTQGAEWLSSLKTRNVRLLGDLFHLNIEEADIAAAIRLAGDKLGHIHFADSNRHAAGFGHIDFVPIVQALRQINYQGYLSAEVFALPDSATAASMTISSFKKLTQPSS